MKRDDLTGRCLYYKGEEQCPYESGDKASFWEYERAWVDMSLAESDALVACWNEYVAQGLADFETEDGTPVLLKALLFSRFVYWLSGTPEEFEAFYKRQYRGQI